MLTCTDTNILKTRPDYLRPVTDHERAAEHLLNTRRKNWLANLGVALGRLTARRVSSRA